jgi:hypothetical protein
VIELPIDNQPHWWLAPPPCDQLQLGPDRRFEQPALASERRSNPARQLILLRQQFFQLVDGGQLAQPFDQPRQQDVEQRRPRRLVIEVFGGV